MLKRLLPFAIALISACAGRAPPAPAPESAPVVISESPPAPAEPAPPPDQPPPPARPAQTDSGRFRISVASTETAERAGAWARKAEGAGYRTEILPVQIDGKTWHRVLLPGYASLDEARAALPFVQQDLGAPDAWVTSRRRAPEPPAN